MATVGVKGLIDSRGCTPVTVVSALQLFRTITNVSPD